MKKVMTVVAVIALAAVVASPAMAYRGMGGGFDRGPGGYATMDPARGLDLTAEQTQKINAMREGQSYAAEIYAHGKVSGTTANCMPGCASCSQHKEKPSACSRTKDYRRQALSSARSIR